MIEMLDAFGGRGVRIPAIGTFQQRSDGSVGLREIRFELDYSVVVVVRQDSPIIKNLPEYLRGICIGT